MQPDEVLVGRLQRVKIDDEIRELVERDLYLLPVDLHCGRFRAAVRQLDCGLRDLFVLVFRGLVLVQVRDEERPGHDKNNYQSNQNDHMLYLYPLFRRTAAGAAFLPIVRCNPAFDASFFCGFPAVVQVYKFQAVFFDGKSIFPSGLLVVPGVRTCFIPGIGVFIRFLVLVVPGIGIRFIPRAGIVLRFVVFGIPVPSAAVLAFSHAFTYPSSYIHSILA